MGVEFCVPVIPSADLNGSLRLWVDGLGFSMSSEMFFLTDDDGYLHCFGVPTKN